VEECAAVPSPLRVEHRAWTQRERGSATLGRWGRTQPANSGTCTLHVRVLYSVEPRAVPLCCYVLRLSVENRASMKESFNNRHSKNDQKPSKAGGQKRNQTF